MATLIKVNELDETIIGFLEWKSLFSYSSFLLLKHFELSSVNRYRWNYCNVMAFVCLLEPSWPHCREMWWATESLLGLFLWTHVGIYLCVVWLMYLSIIIYISVAIYFCIC